MCVVVEGAEIEAQGFVKLMKDAGFQELIMELSGVGFLTLRWGWLAGWVFVLGLVEGWDAFSSWNNLRCLWLSSVGANWSATDTCVKCSPALPLHSLPGCLR